MKEHYTENIRFLKKHGFLKYYLLKPVSPESICRLVLEIKTPKDPPGKSAGGIEIHFMDEYKVGSSH